MIEKFYRENGTIYFNDYNQELFILEGNVYDGFEVVGSTEGHDGITLPKSLIKDTFTLTEEQVRNLIMDAKSVFFDIDDAINDLRYPHTITIEYDGENYILETLKAEY